MLFIISAPSGAGKTSVVQELVKTDPTICQTVSHTTRLPRPNERNGKHYFFVSESEFHTMTRKSQFVETVKVYGHWYGTSYKSIQDIFNKNKNAVLVIESKGARKIHRLFSDSIFILIVPPTLQILKKRIMLRKRSTQESTKVRLQKAKKEMKDMKWYDYLVVNDQLSHTVAKVRAIMAVERLRLKRQVGLLYSLTNRA